MRRLAPVLLVLLSLAAWAASARGGDLRAAYAREVARLRAEGERPSPPPQVSPETFQVSAEAEAPRDDLGAVLDAISRLEARLARLEAKATGEGPPAAKAPRAETADARLKGAGGPPSFAEARRDALARGRPLLVWEGYFCGSSAKRLTDFCHWQAPDGDDSWSDAARLLESDGLTVLVPHGGELQMVPGVSTVAANDVCVNSVRRALRETEARLAGGARPAAQTAWQAPAPSSRAPAFAPPSGGGWVSGG